MTEDDARAWLLSQPTPRLGGSVSVTDWAVRHVPPELRALLLVRREQGRAHYGTELRAHNGRNAVADQLQEAIDGLVYAAQDVIEAHQRDAISAGRAWARFGAWSRLAEILVADIAVEGDVRESA